MDPKLDNQNLEKPIMNAFQRENVSFFTPKLIAVFSIAVILGILSGYIFSQKKIGNITSLNTGNLSSSGGKTVVGSADTKTFKDIAQGILKAGGIDGEGAFHLVRPGGKSQNVYLTSSVVDLSFFIDKKIKVWGQTQSAKHAGWLMDVGRVEVLQ